MHRSRASPECIINYAEHFIVNPRHNFCINLNQGKTFYGFTFEFVEQTKILATKNISNEKT